MSSANRERILSIHRIRNHVAQIMNLSLQIPLKYLSNSAAVRGRVTDSAKSVATMLTEKSLIYVAYIPILYTVLIRNA